MLNNGYLSLPAAFRCQIYDHPWYNKNLPPGVKEMNDHPQPLPVGLQSQEEIQKIVAVSSRACWHRTAGVLTSCSMLAMGSGGHRCDGWQV